MLSTLLSTILVINELMASNAGIVMSPATNFDSWIEVYNPGDEAVSLSGMYLSNTAGNLKLWKMPDDVGSVPAKGFKVVWMGSNDIKASQAPFKLDCDGGTVYLSDANGNLLTSQVYPEAMSRTSWARMTDGGEQWGWTANATPGESNATAKFADTRLAPPVVSAGSQLFTGTLNVKVDIPEGARLMYTTDGSLPAAPKAEGEEVSLWQEWVKNGDCEGTDASCLVSKNGDSSRNENRIDNGVGVGGSRGVKVHAVAKAANDWTTQFFVYTPDHVWQTGERYRFHLKVRADKPATISALAQKKPGENIVNSMLAGSYKVTTEWTEISYEGTLTAEQAGEQWNWGGWGGWGGWEPTVTCSLQTIAFNLNRAKEDNYFYFDDISWESLPLDAEEDPTKESTDGLFAVTATTNYTFRLFQDGQLPSVPVTRSYIQTTNKYTLPVISIVGDKKHFNDPKIGFDCDGDGTNGKTGNGQNSPKNYNMDWDRPVNFSYLSPGGEMLFNQDANISVSGGWTRSQRFRSFKLKANKVYDGQNRYDYPFFPQKPYIRNKVLLVRNGGNDVWTHNARFLDPALETIVQRSGLDLDVQSYVPVIEYVNGELRGVFNLREPNNDKFADANFGYDDEELDAFENMVMKNGTDSVINRILELGRNINSEGAYEELKTLLDIDEYVNYMAVTMYLDNDDWPNNNQKGYRSQKDGRYRFVSFDLDYAFALCGNNTYNEDPFKFFVKFKSKGTVNEQLVNLFLNLLEHDEFRRKYIDTFCLVAGSVFEPNRAGKIVDELLSVVQPVCQLMKQQGINDGHDPKRAADEIKNKLKGRSNKMTSYMQQFSQMKLSGATRQSVTLNADTEGARLFVNGINVPYADFQGHLFAPVRLKAEAPAGYRFDAWMKSDGTIVSTNAETSLPEGATVGLTATFVPLTDSELAIEGITPVRINEVSAANGIYVNEYFKRNDWIELYNTTEQPVDIDGMYLSDNIEKPKKYQITKTQGSNTVIPPHGFLIVWCDKLEPQSQLHALFKLASEGGDMLLTAADESWADRFTYTAMKEDQTAGRYPDGCNNVYQMNVPTIAMANITSSYAVTVSQDGPTAVSDLMADARLSLDYTADGLVVSSHDEGQAHVTVVNMAGQGVCTAALHVHEGCAKLSVSHLPAGIYVATVTLNGVRATRKFVKR